MNRRFPLYWFSLTSIVGNFGLAWGESEGVLGKKENGLLKHPEGGGTVLGYEALDSAHIVVPNGLAIGEKEEAEGGGLRYKPNFGVFEAGIVGRADNEPITLEDNEPFDVTLLSGATQYFWFEGGASDSPSSLSSSSTSTSTATSKTKRSMEEEDDDDENSIGDGESLEKRQLAKTYRISITLCERPQPISKSVTKPIESPTVYVALTKDNTLPGPDSLREDESSTLEVEFDQGLATFLLPAEEIPRAVFSIVMPESKTDYSGSWVVQAAATSQREAFHQSTSDWSPLVWLDSDANASILVSNVGLTDREISQTIDGNPPYVLFVERRDSVKIQGLQASYCGLLRYASISTVKAANGGEEEEEAKRVRNREDVKDGGEVVVSSNVTMRTLGSFGSQKAVPQQQFYVSGLAKDTEYVGIVVSQAFDESGGDQSDTGGRKGNTNDDGSLMSTVEAATTTESKSTSANTKSSSTSTTTTENTTRVTERSTSSSTSSNSNSDNGKAARRIVKRDGIVKGVVNGGGRVYSSTVTFATKSGDNCRLLANLDFCNSTNYAVPGNPSKFNVTELGRFYDDYAREMYANFEKALAQVPCDAPPTSQYSLARNCEDCRVAYKQWLCMVSIPRCEDLYATEVTLNSSSSPSSYRLRNLKQAFPNGTRLPDDIIEPLAWDPAVLSSRSARIDEAVQPGPYKELLPCVDLCYNLVQSCPSSLDFKCPTPEDRNFNRSYAVLDPSRFLSCNFPGAAHQISHAERLLLDVLPPLMMMISTCALLSLLL